MPTNPYQPPPKRDHALDAVQEIAALQPRLLDAWGEFSVLSKRLAGATADERAALLAEFDDLSTRMLANAEAVRSVLVRYHRPEE